ncbi:MAG: hypothetical protein ABIK89_00545, partial [Planctomycetota bacterium]
MTVASLPLLAEGTTRTVLDWGRIESNADLVLPLVVLVAIDVFVRYIIRLDTRELPRLVGWGLTALRMATIFCLFLIYLQPEWRSEREVVRNSRVLLLVDTSSSMGLSDVDASPAGHRREAVVGGANRVEQVAEALDQTDFLNSLRKTHDVVVLRFDEHLNRVISLDKLAAGQIAAGSSGSSDLPGTGGTTDPALAASIAAADDKTDWSAALAPTGAETRLGQA